MKNIIKITLVMLGLVSFGSANAGELTVTGSAKASYVIVSSDSTSAAQEVKPGLGVSNEFNLTANGELDNGYTWKYFINVDGDTTQDDGGLSVTTPMGAVAVNVSTGGLELSKAAAISATGDRGSDSGFDEKMAEEFSIGDMTNIQYHTAADMLPYGIAIKLAYAPDTTAGANKSKNATGGTFNQFTATTDTGTVTQTANMGQDMKSYQVKAEPVTGLNVGASYSEYTMDNVAATTPEAGSWYAKYETGPLEIAYGRSYVSYATASTAALYDSMLGQKMGIGYTINDDLSVSYSEEKSETSHMLATTADVEMKVTQVAAAYTMGGMTLALSNNKYKNVAYTAARDVNSYVFNVAMAF
jgi:hypothetical protein